jgi:hypothetical protein
MEWPHALAAKALLLLEKWRFGATVGFVED